MIGRQAAVQRSRPPPLQKACSIGAACRFSAHFRLLFNNRVSLCSHVFYIRLGWLRTRDMHRNSPFGGRLCKAGAVGTNNCHLTGAQLKVVSFPFLSFFSIFFSYTSAQKMFLSLRAEYSR